MMKPEMKAAWVARLRDPNSRQHQGALRGPIPTNGGVTPFCCLGHLAALCNLTIYDVNGTDADPHSWANNLTGPNTPSTKSPYDPLEIELGLDRKFFSELWTKNDTEGWSLAQIADYIEGNPEI